MAQDTFSLDFSTYVDGVSTSRDWVTDVEVDAAGNIYVTGVSSSAAGISITAGNDYKAAAGSGSLGSLADSDSYVMKFDASGQLQWSTRLGGEGYDASYALELDGAGNVYVAGRAGDGLATTTGAHQTGFAGNTATTSSSLYGDQDGFVARLDGDSGQLDWASYVGGSDGSSVSDMAVAANGDIHLVLSDATDTGDQPITGDAWQSTVKGQTDALYVKMSHDGTNVDYATFVGGTEQTTDAATASIALDKTGDLAIAFFTDATDLYTSASAFQGSNAGGTDAYVVKFDGDTDHRTAVTGTYFGSSADEDADAHILDLDRDGNIVLAGRTFGTDMTTSAGAVQTTAGGAGDGFVSYLSADGTTLLGATYLGGNKKDNMSGVAVTDDGIFVSGAMLSRNFSVTDTSVSGGTTGSYDGFVAKLSLDLTETQYSTFLSGSAADKARTMAVDADGSMIIAGQTRSGDMVTASGMDTTLDGAHGGWLSRLGADDTTPETQADTADTRADTPITIAVLANDSDADGDTLSISANLTTQNGTLRINPNNTLTYTPDAGFTGTDVFTYTATDPAGHARTETVTVNVAPVSPAGQMVLGYNFDYGPEGMVYADDLFRGTDADSYSQGMLSGGAIMVRLGGTDATAVGNMSGGWATSFALQADRDVTVSFRYKAILDASADPNAVGQVLMSLDGVLAGTGGAGEVGTISHTNGVLDTDTGWIHETIDLGTVNAGVHTLSLGAFLNMKAGLDDTGSFYFDDLDIRSTAPSTTMDTGAPVADTDTLVLTIFDDDVDLGNKADNVDAGLGDDVINGKGGADLIFGNAGDDLLSGANHNDTLSGGDGNDTLRGGVGDDVIWGGGGADILYGDGNGGGADTFCFTTDDLGSVDQVKDFNQADGDRLDLSNIVTGFSGLAGDVREFVKITEMSNRSILWVDADGGGGGYTRLAVLHGNLGMDPVETLWSDGAILL